MTDLYAFPVVGRAGLGNMLLPWARAEVFARRSGATVIRPFWNTVRLGPYLRREPQKRDYLNFFSAPDHVRGLTRLLCLARARRLREGEAAPAMASGSAVVCFRGLGEYFAPLADEHDFIRGRLWQMTRPALRRAGIVEGGRFIAMHIRRGDVTRQDLTPEQLAQWDLFTSVAWFAAMARAVRRRNELDHLPIIVFTDGSVEEVADVLRVADTHLHHAEAAIADLWALSHAALLIASGFSTFSMWASFLGGMPTIYPPGKIQQRVQAGRADPLEIELAADDDLPDAVMDRLVGRLAAPPARALALP